MKPRRPYCTLPSKARRRFKLKTLIRREKGTVKYMKILVGLSGGLDSSYTLNVLKNEGHELEGAVLVMHDNTDTEGAERAASEAGIKLNKIDCREAFEREVAQNFTREYARGRTPNPCTVCNRTVKFETLRAFASGNGFDRIATGHYAGVGEANGRFFIKTAMDRRKDQSYMLWKLTQSQLSVLTLPLYGLKKEDVREAARSGGISAADKKESQDICFIPDGDYAAFIESRGVIPVPGDIIDGEGKIIGRHRGIIYYTVGQRRGLGVAAGERMFVSSIDPEKNIVTLLPGGGGKCTEARITDLNYQKLSPCPAGTSLRLSVKIRYSSPLMPCTLRISDKDGAKVRFDEEVRSVTPGQSAVFYDNDGDIALGGSFA